MSEKTEYSENQWKEPKKIWNRMFLSIFFANVTLNMGQQMSNSLLAKYADSLGAPAAQIGLLMSMFAITALAFRFIAGPAMDAFNRKYIVMGAMGFMAAAFFGFAFSKSISSLMFFRLFQGAGQAFGNGCFLAMVADALPKDKFNTGIGYFSCAQVVSQAIGPTVGLWLVGAFGYKITYIITAYVMILAIFAAAQINLAPRKNKKFALNLHNMIAVEAIPPTIITFFICMGFAAINSFLIVYASKRGVENGIGYFFTVYALTMLATRPLVGKLTDEYGFTKVAVPAICLTAASLLFIGFSDKLWMFLVSAFINAFGFGAIQPALQTLAIKSTTPDRRGSASSTHFVGMDAATIIGPSTAGIVAEKFGYASMWPVMTVPVAAGLVAAIILRKRIAFIEEGFKTKSPDSDEK